MPRMEARSIRGEKQEEFHDDIVRRKRGKMV